MVDQRGDIPHRGERWRHRPLVVAAEQRDCAAQFLHAVAADVLSRPQRLLGGRGIAAEHMTGAGDLKHDGSQPVPDEVVDVARDPAPLGQQGLLRELAAGGVKLGRELRLASCGAGDHPGEGDAHEPYADKYLGRVLDQARRHRGTHGKQAERDGLTERWGPEATTNASKDTSNSRGSSCPERWATTTGAITARDSAIAEVAQVGRRGEQRPGAASTRSAADDGSVTAATTATMSAKTGTSARTWSVWADPDLTLLDTPPPYCCTAPSKSPLQSETGCPTTVGRRRLRRPGWWSLGLDLVREPEARKQLDVEKGGHLGDPFSGERQRGNAVWREGLPLLIPYVVAER